MVDRSRVPDASATIYAPERQDRPGSVARDRAAEAAVRAGVRDLAEARRPSKPQPATLFNVDSQGNGVGAIPDDLQGVSAVLVTRERTGGAQTPSEMPIISARI